AGEPLVGYERDIPTRRETDRLLRRYGVEVRYVMELDNVETIKRVVEIGTGLAILPEPAVRLETKSKTLAAVHFSDEVFVRPAGRPLRPHRPPSPGALRERDRADRALPPRHAHERRAAHRRAAARPARLSRRRGCAHVGPRLPHARRPRRRLGGGSRDPVALDGGPVRGRRGVGGQLRARAGAGAAPRG